MPTILTISLTSPAPLFFDEQRPLEPLLRDLLAQAGRRLPDGAAGRLKPYTLSPLWPVQQRGLPAADRGEGVTYRWRACLLEDGPAAGWPASLPAGATLAVGDQPLTIGAVEAAQISYEELATQARQRAGGNDRRTIDLEFLTPVILERGALPYPLPDPAAIFHHYLLAWDTFAPRPLWVNINLLDAIEAHLALIEYRLESRRVRPRERIKTGFLGTATYKLMGWQKLGQEIVSQMHLLAQFSHYCATGALTEWGLGQTRYNWPGRRKQTQ